MSKSLTELRLTSVEVLLQMSAMFYCVGQSYVFLLMSCVCVQAGVDRLLFLRMSVCIVSV